MEYLRISTITGTAVIDTNINLTTLYEGLDINDQIKYIEYGLELMTQYISHQYLC